MINLGKKTIGWKIRVFFSSILWFLYVSPNKKTWEEYKHGLIKHKCDFDKRLKYENDYKYYECKHFGCNMVKPVN